MVLASGGTTLQENLSPRKSNYRKGCLPLSRKGIVHEAALVSFPDPSRVSIHGVEGSIYDSGQNAVIYKMECNYGTAIKAARVCSNCRGDNRYTHFFDPEIIINLALHYYNTIVNSILGCVNMFAVSTGCVI